MKRKIIKRAFFVLLIIGAVLCYYKITTPFKSAEQKKVRPLYSAGISGISIFKLMYVDISEDGSTKNKSIKFNLKMKNNDIYGGISNKELKTLNKFTNQMMDFLNKTSDVNDIDNIGIYLYVDNGRRPEYLNLWIQQINGQFSIDWCIIKCDNTIFDVCAIPDIKYIQTMYGTYDSIDDDSIEKLKSFSELKEIHFSDNVDKQKLIEFKEKLHKNQLTCKIFWGDMEITFPPSSVNEKGK